MCSSQAYFKGHTAGCSYDLTIPINIDVLALEVSLNVVCSNIMCSCVQHRRRTSLVFLY